MLPLSVIDEIYRQSCKYDTETIFHALRNQEICQYSIYFFNAAVMVNSHGIIVIPDYVFQHLSKKSYVTLNEHFLYIGRFITDNGGCHIDTD